MLGDSHYFEPFPQNGRGFWEVWLWEISLMESEVEIVLEERLVMTAEKMGWDTVLTKVGNVSQFQWNEDLSMGPEAVNI